jgi:hypothetical protein
VRSERIRALSPRPTGCWMEGRSAALLQTNTPTLKGGGDWLGRRRDVVTCSPRIPSLAKTSTSVLCESHNLLFLPSLHPTARSISPGNHHRLALSIILYFPLRRSIFSAPPVFSLPIPAAALPLRWAPPFGLRLGLGDESGHAIIAVQPIPLHPPANLKSSRLPLRRAAPFHPATTLDPHRQSRSSAAFNPENGEKQHQQRGFV